MHSGEPGGLWKISLSHDLERSSEKGEAPLIHRETGLRDTQGSARQLSDLHHNNVFGETVLILEHPTKVIQGQITYTVLICGDERTDGTWQAWLEFQPTDHTQPVLRTDQETSQPNRIAIEYWAGGLEPIYLQGALARAQKRLL